MSSRTKSILWELLKLALETAILLGIAAAAARLKLSQLISEDWAGFSWGVSQSLVAGAIALMVGGLSAVRRVREHELLKKTVATLKAVLDEDITPTEAQAFNMGSLKKTDLQRVTADMLAGVVRARQQLDKAIGRIEGAVPELSEDFSK